VDGSGRRIDQGPTSIVSDPKQADRTVTNGVSCMSCHYAGVIPKTDEVGPVVRANPKAFTNSADILALYRKPEDLNQVLAADSRRFSDGMKQIGITSLSRSGEPISAMAHRFQEQIELPMAAAELGLSPIEFAEKLDMAQSTARALAPLRVPGGTIKRDVFVTIFQQAAVEMRLTTEARHGGPAGARPGQALASVVSIPQRTTTTTDTSSRVPPGFGPPGFGPPGFGPQGFLPSGPGMQPNSTITRTSTSSIRIESLTFSPSGNLLVAGCDKEIIVFDPVQAAPLQTIEKLELLGSIEKCLFTPSGTQLLAVGKNGPIFVFDAQKDGSFKQCGQFPGHSGAVKSIAVSADGKFAVSGGSEKKVRYWEIATGEEKAAFGGFSMNIKAVSMAKNGRTALATDGMVLQTLDLVRRDVLRTRKLSRGSGEAAFSPDGNYLAVGDGNRIHLYNLNSTTEMPGLQDSDFVTSLIFTPDSNRLVTGGSGKINAWDFKKQRKIFTEALQSSGSVDAIAVTPDSTHVAALPIGLRRQVQIFRLPGADNK
jgi:WD40 domain-containing protein